MTPTKIQAYDFARSPYPWSFNEYSELRTIPACWNMEAVKTLASSNGHGERAVQEALNADPDQKLAAAPEMKNHVDDAILEWHRDRFMDSFDTKVYWALTW